MSLDVYLGAHVDLGGSAPEWLTVWEANITHNLGTMACNASGRLYCAVWRPDEEGLKTAADVLPVLVDGIATLKAQPDRFRELNPPNGWGTYEGLVEFLEDYRDACEKWPKAEVEASR